MTATALREVTLDYCPQDGHVRIILDDEELPDVVSFRAQLEIGLKVPPPGADTSREDHHAGPEAHDIP